MQQGSELPNNEFVGKTPQGAFELNPRIFLRKLRLVRPSHLKKIPLSVNAKKGNKFSSSTSESRIFFLQISAPIIAFLIVNLGRNG